MKGKKDGLKIGLIKRQKQNEEVVSKRNVNKTDLQHGDLAPTTNGVHPMV